MYLIASSKCQILLLYLETRVNGNVSQSIFLLLSIELEIASNSNDIEEVNYIFSSK